MMQDNSSSEEIEKLPTKPAVPPRTRLSVVANGQCPSGTIRRQFKEKPKSKSTVMIKKTNNNFFYFK